MTGSIKPRIDAQGLHICDGCDVHFESDTAGRRFHSQKCQHEKALERNRERERAKRLKEKEVRDEQSTDSSAS